MTNTKTRALRTADRDVNVRWRPGFKPSAFPHECGTLFFVKGKAAFVFWHGGDGRAVPVARKALHVVL